MNIYLISYDYMNNFLYDAYDAHVVAANSEDEVRQLAKEHHADEGKHIWETADIIEQGIYTGEGKEPFIILSSFNAG